MSNDWENIKIKDIADINIETYSSKEDWDFVNYLDTSNITENKIDEIKFIDLTKEKLPSRAKRKVQEFSILFSTVRPNQKHYGIIKESIENFLVSTAFVVINADKTKADPYFLYYLLIQDEIIEFLSMIAEQSTSAYPSIKSSNVENLEFLVPPLKEQQKISKILSSLDEKIEINRKINENLEKQAKEIFKRWFIDYEFPNEEGQPYKSSGGEMIESELGLIPKGWEVKKLESIINISNGRRPKNKIKLKNRQYCIPIIGSSCITGYTDEFLYDEHVLVIGRVGTHGIVQRFKEKIWVSDNAMVIKSNYYEYTNQILNNICYENLNVGSTQPLITQSDIKKHLIKVPINRLINSFEKIVSSLYEKYYFNECEIQKLSSLRDTLLPKLMTGEIDVSEIDI